MGRDRTQSGGRDKLTGDRVSMVFIAKGGWRALGDGSDYLTTTKVLGHISRGEINANRDVLLWETITIKCSSFQLVKGIRRT